MKTFSLDYTKVAEAESNLFEGIRSLRMIDSDDSKVISQIFEAIEHLERSQTLLREYLNEDNLKVTEE